MLPFKSLIEIKKNKVPVYRQISDSIIRHIREGTIQPGAPLPGSRSMAALLGVHRNTITAAYDELLAQGWIISKPRKGMQVAVDPPLLHVVRYQQITGDASHNNKSFFNFERHFYIAPFRFPEKNSRNAVIINDGFPDIELAPVDIIIREYRRQLDNRHLKKAMYLRDHGGSPGIKQATRDFLNDSRGLKIGEKNILITRGAQMAIYIAASLILQRGDTVVVSEPNYFIANQLFEKLGAKLVAMPTDKNGMMVERIEEFVSLQDIRLLYVVPHHHHPTTVTLSAERRSLLLAMINEFNIPLIEDDYDYDFHYSNKPVLPLASGNHNGNVIYIGSYTKLLAPSFRIGYMVAAENFIHEATTHRRLMDLRGDMIMEEAIAQLINSGEMTRHIRRSLTVYRKRRNLMYEFVCSKLDGSVHCALPDGGLALWVRFNKDIPLGRLIEKAASENIFLSGSSYYLGTNQKYNGIRLGFASLTEPEMEKAFSVLENAIHR
jgi:GntR family transcriptional regulator/MocR family aminotransferase